MEKPSTLIHPLEEEYDAWYREYPDKWTGQNRNEFMLTVIGWYPEPESIIEIGCGNGHTLKTLSLAYPKAGIYGLELSGEALRLTKAKVPSVTTIHSALEEYTDNGFDCVVCMGVAEHFENLGRSLLSLRDITDGICYLEVPNNLLYSPGEHCYRRLCRGSQQWEWHLTREEWEKQIEFADFRILESFVGQKAPWEFIWVLG